MRSREYKYRSQVISRRTRTMDTFATGLRFFGHVEAGMSKPGKPGPSTFSSFRPHDREFILCIKSSPE